MGQGIEDDGVRKSHRMLNAAATPAMSREYCDWTYLTASGQLRIRGSSADDISDCLTCSCMARGALFAVNGIERFLSKVFEERIG